MTSQPLISVQYDQQTNVWDAVSFLRFIPMLQHLQIIDSNSLKNPFPNNQPVLQFLTVLECASLLCAPDFGQCMLELLKCTPMLKKIRCAHLGMGFLDTLDFKKALRLVRNTIEEIEFDGSFKDGDNTTKYFPKLTKISTNVELLIPRPENRLNNFSLLELLPPYLESLYFTDERGFLVYGGVNPYPYVFDWDQVHLYREQISTFYKLLEDVALAKERGPLKKLASISMGFICHVPKVPLEEYIRGVAAICESSGIEWKHRVLKFNIEEDNSLEINNRLGGPKWHDGYSTTRQRK